MLADLGSDDTGDEPDDRHPTDANPPDAVGLPVGASPEPEEWREGAHLHRIDAPARVWPDGTCEYFHHGQRHRADGPAIESPSAAEWWVDGRLHRPDGPAVEGSEGREWWVAGHRHRTDGPAVEGVGEPEWWLQGQRVPYSQWLTRTGRAETSMLAKARKLLGGDPWRRPR